MNAKPILSILITSNEGREAYLESLKYNIARQMLKNNLKDGIDIEVIVSKDMKGQYTDGEKMNALLQSCNGDWALILTDAYQLADDYLANAINLIKTKNPDCINTTVFMTTNGLNPVTINYELKNKKMTAEVGVCHKPICHLNIIRTQISKGFQFSEIGAIEDVGGWSDLINKADVVKTEGRIENITCYYQKVTV